MSNKRILVVFVLIMPTMFLLSGCGQVKEKKENADDKEMVIPSSVEFHDEDAHDMSEPQNELGFKLLPKINSSDTDAKNMFISPTSLFMALSMAYNGADGETKKEMAGTLNLEDMDLDELNRANAALMTWLHDKLSVDLTIANSLWLNDRFSLEEPFQKQMTDYFNAKIEEIDIDDSVSVDHMNHWVKAATNSKIDDMVEVPLHSDLVAFLINVIYFNGNWHHEFNSDLTEPRDFHTVEGTKELPFMHLEADLNYMENDLFQVVELPYQNQEMSMHVVLPKEGSSLETFYEAMSRDQWQKWMNELTEREGHVMLPKFELEYEVTLNDALKALGMGKAFSSKVANFSNMAKGDDPVFIYEIKQKSYLNISEEGTEAAAATSIEMRTESYSPTDPPPFQMIVDRPFFFTITDNETNAILFMGTIFDPSSNGQ